jgi:hypothetical protein
LSLKLPTANLKSQTENLTSVRAQSVDVKQRLQLLLDAKMTLDEALQLRNVKIPTAHMNIVTISLTFAAESHRHRSCGSRSRPLMRPSYCLLVLRWG